MAEVILENVTRSFPNGAYAVRDLNLTVRDGERVVLVGPSGSGKSTALRIIAGLESLTSGSVHIGGRNVNAMPPRDRNVAMVFQRPTLYPHLNVRDNLAFGCRLREGRGQLSRLLARFFSPRRSEHDRRFEEELSRRVDEASRFLKVQDLLDRLPRQLSGGEQQRVALGRALVRRPAVFLLDEPLSSLEPRLRTDLRRELHLLQRRLHATMIYVTHDQTEALTFGERVVVLDRGVVQQMDRPEILFEKPRNRFVAGFIGWPSMNFVAGRYHAGRLEGNGWGLALTQRGSLDGASVELGIRPEHVALAAAAEPGRTLAMTVELVETLGADTLVTCRRESYVVAVKQTARPAVEPGQTVEVSFDMTRAHLFDAATGRAL